MYVYILSSKVDNSSFYVGSTIDLKKRLEQHNQGEVPATKRNGPWFIHAALWLRTKEKAIAFERYLKTHSGRSFQKKRF